MLLNFPRRYFENLGRHLHLVAQLFQTNERRFLTIVVTIRRHKYLKLWRAGSLEAKIGDIHTHFCTLKFPIYLLLRESKLGLYYKQFKVNLL